jgi:hypothetical protein
VTAARAPAIASISASFVLAAADSTGERNGGGQCISWGAVGECLAGSAVEF